MRFTSRSFRRNVSKKTRKAREKRRFKQVRQRTRRYKPKGFFIEKKPVVLSFNGGSNINNIANPTTRVVGGSYLNPTDKEMEKMGATKAGILDWDDQQEKVTIA